MFKIKTKSKKATWSHFHMLAGITWAALAYPSIFYWGKNLEYLTALSVYAIIVGHWGSYQAARAEEN